MFKSCHMLSLLSHYDYFSLLFNLSKKGIHKKDVGFLKKFQNSLKISIMLTVTSNNRRV